MVEILGYTWRSAISIERGEIGIEMLPKTLKGCDRPPLAHGFRLQLMNQGHLCQDIDSKLNTPSKAMTGTSSTCVGAKRVRDSVSLILRQM